MKQNQRVANAAGGIPHGHPKIKMMMTVGIVDENDMMMMMMMMMIMV